MWALLSHRWRAGKINSKKHSLGDSNTSISCSMKHQFDFKNQTEIVRIFMISDSELIPSNKMRNMLLDCWCMLLKVRPCIELVVECLLTNQGIWITRWAKGPHKNLAIYTILLWNQFLHENTSVSRAASSTCLTFFCEK